LSIESIIECHFNYSIAGKITSTIPNESPLSFITMGIALPRQGSVPGLTGMSSHTQSDFHCLETKKPAAGWQCKGKAMAARSP
jgi:hypothetical protein